MICIVETWDKWVASLMENHYVGSAFADTGSPTVGSSRSWQSMEMEIQSLLEKLLDINDAMSRCAASATPTTSVVQKLARHRDILHEFTQVILLMLHFILLLAFFSLLQCIHLHVSWPRSSSLGSGFSCLTALSYNHVTDLTIFATRQFFHGILRYLHWLLTDF